MVASKARRKTTKRKTRKTEKQPATEPVKSPSVHPHNWTDSGEKVLILRRCNQDGSSSHGFVWPKEGHVEFPDFDPTPKCGGGGHGWPWGMGLGEGAEYDIIGDLWLVVAAIPMDVVGELEGGWKCKVRACDIAYCGPFAGAWAMINSGRHRLIDAMARDTGGVKDIAAGFKSKAASSGNSSKAASSGNSSKAASSGDYSTAASSGNYSTAASSGDYSTAASSGDYSKAASSGDYSTAASSGDYSKAASSGNSSKAASSGDYSTAASSGDYSKAASSGDYSTAASSGDSSTANQEGKSGIAASIGTGGCAKAGEHGLLIVCFWSEPESRYRVCIGNVGENGIKADTWYKVVNGALVEA